MRFHTVDRVRGAMLIALEQRTDDRGFFARAFCDKEFSEHGLETRFVQANVSRSRFKGTLRGMHYQLGPSAEVKLVRCTAGAIFDVVLDLRPNSPSFGQWFGDELNAENHHALYVPRGCAHGFVTLCDEAEVFYLVSSPYDQERERSIRYNDPRFAISWPQAVAHISAKDADARDFDPVYHGVDTLKDFA